MTRLVPTDINDIPTGIKKYDLELKRKTGSSLKDIAIMAAGSGNLTVEPANYRVAVIPVTAGLGPISGFCKAVSVIASYLGFDSYVTELPDVGGLNEAFSKEFDLVMMADDQLFAAFNLQDRQVVNNDEATARGYVTALNCMAGGLNKRTVLLTGAGKVGELSAELLLGMQAELIIYDIDRKRENQLAGKILKKYGITVITGMDLPEALSRCEAVFDASPGDAFIKGDHIRSETLVAAPGMPLGLDAKAYAKVAGQTIHDPLQIGVATMLYCSLVYSKS